MCKVGKSGLARSSSSFEVSYLRIRVLQSDQDPVLEKGSGSGFLRKKFGSDFEKKNPDPVLKKNSDPVLKKNPDPVLKKKPDKVF